MSAGLRLTFGAPRYLDRLLPLQLGQIQPVGIALACEVRRGSELVAGATDLVEVPLEVLLESAASDRALVGLPVFPDRLDAGSGPLVPRSVIALRRSTYERDRTIVAALLDAFEASRKAAYERLAMPASPALALPWLTDQVAADERRFGGDPYPVGFAANREGLAAALAELGDGAAADPGQLFAPESIAHQPQALREEPAAAEPGRGGAVRCRGLRYVDRSLSLEVGAVTPVGVDFDYVGAPSLAGALSSVIGGEFALAEILLGDLVAERAGGEDRLLGLPVFPARRYPQRCFWVPTESPASSYADLAGARIGFPPGGATAAAWARARLEGAGVEAHFEVGPIGLKPLDRGFTGPTLGRRSLAGELDAVISPYPVPVEDSGDRLRPLLADPAADERDQAERQGFVPISNVLVIGREAYERDPEAVPALLDAFLRSRAEGRAGLLGEPPTVALPRIAERVAEAERLLGGDPYPHGVEANRETLAGFARHLAAIGSVRREVAVDEMFAPRALA